MPREQASPLYLPSKSGTTSTWHFSAENMQRALTEVREKMSIKKAAFLYGLNRTTLMNHLKQQHCGAIGRPTLLTPVCWLFWSQTFHCRNVYSSLAKEINCCRPTGPCIVWKCSVVADANDAARPVQSVVLKNAATMRHMVKSVTGKSTKLKCSNFPHKKIAKLRCSKK